MKNKVLIIMASLAIITAGAAFAQQPTLDKLSFMERNEGKSYMAQPLHNNISGAVVIPDTYNGKPVTEVGGFGRCTEITSVVLPAGITQVGGGYSQFQGCTKLTSITFPKSNISGTQNVWAGYYPGDLLVVYRAGGAGTYTRPEGSNNWTKSGGVPCPICGQTAPCCKL